MENYYKKYPHFGPGGSRHTYFSKITGKEELGDKIKSCSKIKNKNILIMKLIQ